MTTQELEHLLELATQALADIAYSDDLTASQRRKKAGRVYEQIRATFAGPAQSASAPRHPAPEGR